MANGNWKILREGWTLAKPYWSSEEKWVAWALVAGITFGSLGQVWVNVRLNSWLNDFYNALQNYDERGCFYQLGLFTLFAGIFIVLAVYQTYLQQMLQIRWRRWMTDNTLRRWLGHGTYYRLQLEGGATDNPDQRIAEDLNSFALQTLNLAQGLLTNVVQAVSFSFILWDLSGALAIPLGAWGVVRIPGYMFWAALIYTVIGTWITVRIGRPLVSLNFQQQRLEADFRFGLIRVRENAESVAFYGGEDQEGVRLRGRFGSVFENFWAIMRRQKALNWFVSGYNQAAVIFPYLIAAPRYFSKEFQLGGLQQVAGAFLQLQGSLAYIINSYSDSSNVQSIVNWESVILRLATFRDRMAEIEASAALPQPIAIERCGDGIARGIEIDNLSLALPDGAPLRQDIGFTVDPGGSLLITGPTGAGKSTLLRAVAGIWPFGAGRVKLPSGRSFFLPQRPYLPLGTLRQVLTYPDPSEGVPDGRLQALLGQMGLAHLASELDTETNWAQRLSLGEQQRIGFARILLAEPATIFLDEATASLDEAGEALLYGFLRDLPWKPTIVSIGHRATLRAFHDCVLDFAARG